MRSASAAFAFATLAALASTARADEEVTPGTGAGPATKHAGTQGQQAVAAMLGTPSSPDLRTYLGQAFSAQAAAASRAEATVAEKLAAATVARTGRVRAAYRALLSDATVQGSLDELLALARRRAAARYLLARDRHEIEILGDEHQRLVSACARIDHDRAGIAGIELPAHLAWPVPGKVVRRFGPLLHEHSGAYLSRRGIDIETAEDAQVRAAAGGTVSYVGPIRGLDDGVIVEHGSYYTVTAKLSRPTARVGANVTRGQVLGHVLRHRAYFEVRVRLGPGGLPIDPESVLPEAEVVAPPAPEAAATH